MRGLVSGLFYLVPLICVSVFVPIPCYFDYFSFVVLSEVLEGYAPSFVLFRQDCFDNSGSLVFLYTF